MKVVRVSDFDIPSDENDYDELVAFADTMARIEEFEAIPKADYEARLKADLITILDKVRTEVEQKLTKGPWLNYENRERDSAFLEVLDVIDKYKAEQEQE